MTIAFPRYTPPPRYWTGKAPAKCDICGQRIGASFTDGKTSRGPWGIMCDPCLPRASIARTNHWGTGIGQHYERQNDGRYLKTAG